MISRDIVFHEKHFPFNLKQNSKPSFPIFYLSTNTIAYLDITYVTKNNNETTHNVANPTPSNNNDTPNKAYTTRDLHYT